MAKIKMIKKLISLPEKLLNKLKGCAQKDGGIPVTEIIRRILLEYFKD